MFAERVSAVSPFLAVEVYSRALEMERAGRNIVHLEIGEPDFNTPQVVGEALKGALSDGYTHYTDVTGDPALRESVAGMFKRRYGVELHPDQVLCFPGTSPALLLLFSALLNPGDEVILSDPGYPCHTSAVRFSGGVPVVVPTHEEDGFRFEPAEVRARLTAKTKALVINSPCNPTGVLLEPQRMQELADLGVLVVSDEIYHGLNYSGGRDHTILEYTDNAVVIGGFSKAYAMTGWRLGYLVVPRHMVAALRTLMQHFFISASSLIQRAGVAAMTQTDAEVEYMRQRYDERRRVMLQQLRGLGFGIKVEPQGAFYILANARHLGSDSYKLAFSILEEAGVGVTPGIDFGSQAEGFLRFSYASSLENIDEAMRRLAEFVARHGR